MSILAVDELMLREPRLLVPRMAPIGKCKVREPFANAKLIYCPAVGDTRNLAPVVGAGASSGVIMPITGTVTATGTMGGLAHTGTANGDYILSGIGPNTGEHLSTFVLVVGPATLAASARPFATRRDLTTATDYAGFYVDITSAGAVNINYGDATGNSSTDRRSLTTPAGARADGVVSAISGHFYTSTTGILYINGVPQSLTPSGTGGTIGGSGNINIHDIHSYASTAFLPILLLVLFNTALSESIVASLSYDPFQIFEPA